MAITAADAALWAELRRLDAIPPNPSLVEIGQANWYGDLPLPEGCDGTPAGLFEAGKRFWEKTLSPSRWAAIDPHGTDEPHVFNLDLNRHVHPEGFGGPFDVLANTGTAEHVFNQASFWENCHELTRPGGLMVHGLPWCGWVQHGLYNYQPQFVLDLAAANGYEVVLFWVTTIQPFSFQPVFKPGGKEGEALVCDLRQDSMLHVALRRHAKQGFRTPWQDDYRPEAAWEKVPGWLTRAEGDALQRLASYKEVLELGAWKGRSTCCMAERAQHVTSVDHFRGDLDTGLGDTWSEWRANTGPHRHKVGGVTATFADALGSIPPNKYGLVFVDGEHSADGTGEALAVALRAVKVGGVVAIHDWHRATVREGAARHGLLTPDGAAGSLAWFNLDREAGR